MAETVGSLAMAASVLLNISPIRDVYGEREKESERNSNAENEQDRCP